jgi:hypothetical protein
MKRALSLTCVTLILLVAGSALAKPQIAVLGLELQGSDITPQDAQAAAELTQGLRGRAKVGSGPYGLAPGSDKELIDEKMLKGCDSEAPACMSTIGNDVNADYVIYGNIERKGDKYVVDIKLLNVARKMVEKRWPGQIPVKDANATGMPTWAKKIYSSLTGQASGGALVVKVGNVDRATVLVDGSEKGNVVNGKAEISGLAPGPHKVTIQPMSELYQPMEKSVTIGDDTETISVDLEKKSTVTPPHECDPRVENCEKVPPPITHKGSSKGAWRGAFYASVGVGVVGGGVWLWQYSKLNAANDDLCKLGAPAPGSSCSNPGMWTNSTEQQKQYADANERGHSADRNTHIAAYVTAGAAVAALGTFYMGFIRSGGDDSAEHASRNGRVHRDRFVVTPVVTPDGGGATLRFDW